MAGADVAELCGWVAKRRAGLVAFAAWCETAFPDEALGASGRTWREQKEYARDVARRFDDALAACASVDGLRALRVTFAEGAPGDFGSPPAGESDAGLQAFVTELVRARLAGETAVPFQGGSRAPTDEYIAELLGKPPSEVRVALAAKQVRDEVARAGGGVASAARLVVADLLSIDASTVSRRIAPFRRLRRT